MTPREWLLFAMAVMWCLFGIFVAVFKGPHWSQDVWKLAPKGTFPEKEKLRKAMVER